MWQTCLECVRVHEHDRTAKNKPGPTQYWSRTSLGVCFLHHLDVILGRSRAGDTRTWDSDAYPREDEDQPHYTQGKGQRSGWRKQRR
jgi:hypothetical protein